MTQTKADRQAAAKKAAATRERNRIREESSERGHDAASSRFQRQAQDSVKEARRAAGQAASNAGGAVKSVGDAAFKAGKSVATKVGIGRR
jgi:hypothetical protein